MGSRTKVLILCVNRLLRESIARILAKRTDFEIITAPVEPGAPIEPVRDSGADVLVLDSLDLLHDNFASPLTTGTDEQSVKSVLIAMTDDRSSFLTSIRRGARGYVLQNASATDVVSAVRSVAEGHAVCPPHYTEVLFDYVATQTTELPNSQKRAQWGLTRREQQLIPLIGRGLSNKEIANHLNISEQTVKNHIHRILRKVGVVDRLSIYEVLQNEGEASFPAHAGHSA
jgi:two-component system, NarL family, response regulator DevR